MMRRIGIGILLAATIAWTLYVAYGALVLAIVVPGPILHALSLHLAVMAALWIMSGIVYIFMDRHQ
jgi:predicted HAD superfamily Cof-like phosphohydrolase